MGDRYLSKVQVGKETDRGTAVAADTYLLAAPLTINPDRKPSRPADQVGLRVKSARSHYYEYLVRNSLKMDGSHPGYFQCLPVLFSCGLRGNITPTETTPGQGDYLWDFTPDLDGSNTPDSLTLEAGDDTQAYEAEYVMFESYKISGEVNQDGGDCPVSIEATFFGRQWSTCSFTGAIVVPTVENMNAKLAQFYLDTAWAGVGGTEKKILRAFDIEILTGVHPIFRGSTTRYFDTHGESLIDFLASFTFEGGSDADAILDLMNSQALSVARLAIIGSQIGTGTNHKLTIDLGGTWEDVIPLASEDRGNNLHTAVLAPKYDSVGAKLLQLSVTTNIAGI